jgi:hypothetical protein
MKNEDEIICGTQLRMEWLQRYGADELRVAKGNVKSIRIALCRYLKQGKGAGFSTGELVDWLGVSTPSILGKAGYSDGETEEAMQILGQVTDSEIDNVQIGPKPYLP